MRSRDQSLEHLRAALRNGDPETAKSAMLELRGTCDSDTEFFILSLSLHEDTINPRISPDKWRAIEAEALSMV